MNIPMLLGFISQDLWHKHYVFDSYFVACVGNAVLVAFSKPLLAWINGNDRQEKVTAQWREVQSERVYPYLDDDRNPHYAGRLVSRSSDNLILKGRVR